MAKGKKELRLDMPFKEWIAQRYTKEELVDNAAIIGMGGVELEDKKEKVIERWESYIHHSTDAIIDVASVFELEMMQKLMLPQNRFGIVSRNIDAVMPITQTGIIISAPHPLGKGYAVYMMLDEVKEAFRLYVELELQSRKQYGCHRLEQLALGVLNVFGGMKAQDWFDYIEWLMDANDKKQWRNWQDYLANNTLFAARRIFHINPVGRTDCFFASPYIDNDDDWHRLFNDVIWDTPAHEYKAYPKQMVMEFGQLPFPRIAVPSMNKLRDMMLNAKERPYTEEEADYVLYRLWLTRELDQTEENVDVMLEIPLRVPTGERQDDYGVNEAMVDSYKDIPMWDMDGRSLSDILKPRKDTPASTKKVAAATQPNIVPMMPPTMLQPPTRKIGRNEPCWCGSGLKYKNCHGKNR